MEKNRAYLAVGIVCLGILCVTMIYGRDDLGSLRGSPAPPSAFPTTDDTPRQALTQNYTNFVDLSDSYNWSKQPSIAVDSQNNTHVVWADQNGNSASNYSIFYRMFDYSTQQWSVTVNISDYNFNTASPSITVGQNKSSQECLYVVWQQFKGPDWEAFLHTDIVFATKPLAAPVGERYWWRVNVIDDSSTGDRNPRCATSAGIADPQVQVVWEKFSAGQWHLVGLNQTVEQIYVRYGSTTDIWTRLGTPATIYNSGTVDSSNLDVAASGTFFVVWESSSSIFCMNSSLSWAQGYVETVDAAGTNSEPDVAVCAGTGRVFVIYLKQGGDSNDDVYILNRTTATKFSGMGSPVPVATGQTNWEYYKPTIVVEDTETWHAAWVLENDTSYFKAQYTRNSAPAETVSLLTNDQDYIRESEVALALIHEGNVQFAWQDNNTYGTYAAKDVIFRELDRTGSYFQVLSPLTSWTQIEGNISFQVQTDPEARVVRYYYRDSDGAPWFLIAENASWPAPGNLWIYDWALTSPTPKVEFDALDLRINVTDPNGIVRSWQLDDLIVDNNAPHTVEILNVTDTMDPANFNNNTPGYMDQHFGNAVSVWFRAVDNVTGIKKVELLNASGEVINSTNFNFPKDQTLGQFVITEGNVTWENISIRAYDYFDHTNKSANYTQRIRIDHVVPRPFFASLYNGTSPLTGANTEISGLQPVTMVFPLDEDVASIHLYNRSSNTVAFASYGVDSDGSDGWSVTFDSRAFVTAPYMEFLVEVTDLTGYTNTTRVVTSIDNKAPDFVLVEVTPSTLVGSAYQVGYGPRLKFLSEIDTCRIEIFNGSRLPMATLTFDNNALAYDMTANKVNGTFIWNTVGVTLAEIYLQFVCYDNNNLTTSIQHRFILIKYIPPSPSAISTTYDATSGNVTISWDEAPSSTGAMGYVVYRFNQPEDTAALTDMIRYDQGNFVFNYLELNATRVGQVPRGTLNLTESHLPPRKSYHYIVMSNFTSVGNLGYVNDIASVEVPATYPDNQPDTSFRRMIINYGIVLLVILVMIPVIGVVRAKKSSREKALEDTMDAKEKRKFDDQAFGLDKRLKEMDRVIEETLGKEVTVSADESDFLSSVVETEEPAAISTPLLDMELGKKKKKEKRKVVGGQCPECGWMLSKTAKKCPRCGYVVAEEGD